MQGRLWAGKVMGRQEIFSVNTDGVLKLAVGIG